jgi:hypothetical protein
VLNLVAHTVNIKISRVKHNLFLVGMEFSYICKTAHFSKRIAFLEVCERNQAYVQQTQVSPICFIPSFLPCALGPSHFSLPLQSTRNTRTIPKSTSDWPVKKIQNREQNFIIWNSYIHNCITELYGTVTYITALLYYMEQLHT